MRFDLEQVEFSYQPQQALFQDFSLSIPSGQALVLLGRNGCGKSTLLKMLAGLIFPQGGRLKADGLELQERSFHDRKFAQAYRRKVNLLFQNSDTQNFCATVLEELHFGPLCLGLVKDEAQKRVADVIEMFQLEPLLGRMPHQLSGGEKKKVALAALLTVNPEVLLLDEPTGGLDFKTQHELVGLLQFLIQAGKTVITATHQLDLVPLLGQRVILLEPGRILADGSAKVIFNNLACLQQAGLIGSNVQLDFEAQEKLYRFSYCCETVK